MPICITRLVRAYLHHTPCACLSASHTLRVPICITHLARVYLHHTPWPCLSALHTLAVPIFITHLARAYLHHTPCACPSHPRRPFHAPACTLPCAATYTLCVGLARTIYIRCTYGIFGLEITKYTVYIYVYIRFWPTLALCLLGFVLHPLAHLPCAPSYALHTIPSTHYPCASSSCHLNYFTYHVVSAQILVSSARTPCNVHPCNAHPCNVHLAATCTLATYISCNAHPCNVHLATYTLATYTSCNAHLYNARLATYALATYTSAMYAFSMHALQPTPVAIHAFASYALCTKPLAKSCFAMNARRPS